MTLGRAGFICIPRTVALAVEMAQAAEEGGFWGLGIGDSQARYMELYAVAGACLAATKSLTVGPIVANPVTRHPTVHAAAARTLEELAPGRGLVGLAAGNSSVRSVGLAPAGIDELVSCLETVREFGAQRVPVLVATDAPRLAAVAGRLADGLIIGTGLDRVAVTRIRDHAEAARREAGIVEPLDTWLSVPLIMAEDEEELRDSRGGLVGVAVSMARRSLAGDLAERNVPQQFRSILSDRLVHYDMRFHGSVSDSSPNDVLFSDQPELEDYLVERFTIAGTAETCRRRLEAVIAETGVANFWFSSIVADPVRNIRLAAEINGL
jgi:alkanesulfonate monooxygenase SsuD/methylene tetrahydromethanopterin reductase-like flavin-dependent oxidoreductase (luciferase family)